MFSPILPIRPLRTSSTRRAEAVLRQRQRRQRGHVGRVAARPPVRRTAWLKARNDVVLRDEVGLAVDFDQRAGAAVGGRGDHAFGGDARRGLAGLVAELDAQDLFGALHVAVGLGQGLLAFHHRRIGLGAQFGDHACGNCGHLSLHDKCRPVATAACRPVARSAAAGRPFRPGIGAPAPAFRRLRGPRRTRRRRR